MNLSKNFKNNHRTKTSNLFFTVLVFFFIFSCDSSYKTDNSISCDSIFNCFDDSIYSRFNNKSSVCFSYELARDKSLKEDRDILIYFNSFSCVNCRSFEDSILFDIKISNLIKKKYIYVVLFVDEKREMKSDTIYYSKFSKRKIKTIGEFNSDFQLSLTSQGSQPLFAMIDKNGNLKKSYNDDIDKKKFYDWISN